MTREYEAELRARVTERLSRFDDPLIPALIYWIEKNALWAACEAVGMVKGGTGVLVTPKEAAAGMLKVLQDAMRRKLE